MEPLSRMNTTSGSKIKLHNLTLVDHLLVTLIDTNYLKEIAVKKTQIHIRILVLKENWDSMINPTKLLIMIDLVP